MRSGSVYSVLLNEGIDSVLNANHLLRDQTMIVIDSARRQKSERQTIQIERLRMANNIFLSTKEKETGAYLLSAGGSIFQNGNQPTLTFSFERSKAYSVGLENSSSDRSFWDSTAKPILVTLGAVAVIALFFLIRG